VQPSPTPRWTSGRECWVFRAESPDELCGHHPQLISSALAPGEPLDDLIYSPIFAAREGPFRVGGEPGSHAVALTPGRLLVSRDPHSEGGTRSVQSIDLGTILAIEIGSALTLGWFVVRFSTPEGAASRPVLFNAQGMPFFRSIVRAYLQPAAAEWAAAAPALDWPGVWQDTPPYLTRELAPLTRETDPPLAVLRTPERWVSEQRRWRRRAVCASAPGLLVATSLGLLWAASEPRMEPDGLSFGVNVTAVRAGRVAGAAISTRETRVPLLRARAGDLRTAVELEVPFDRDDMGSAEEVVRQVAAWGSRP
jgi:hypothetical protein